MYHNVGFEQIKSHSLMYEQNFDWYEEGLAIWN